LDLWPLVPHVRSEAGVGPEWDPVIERQLAQQFHDRGFAPAIEVAIPAGTIAEAVAATAHLIEIQSHHLSRES